MITDIAIYYCNITINETVNQMFMHIHATREIAISYFKVYYELAVIIFSFLIKSLNALIIHFSLESIQIQIEWLKRMKCDNKRHFASYISMLSIAQIYNASVYCDTFEGEDSIRLIQIQMN